MYDNKKKVILFYSKRLLLLVYEFISIKFEFEPSPATTMATDQAVYEVPPSLSAKVVGYVDS